MAIELDPITSGYSTGKINENFQDVENELNNNVLRRKGLAEGEANQMDVTLDMNSNPIINTFTDVNDPDSLLTVGDADFRYLNYNGDSVAGNLNMGGFRIQGLGEPLLNGDAARLQDVQNALAGGAANLISFSPYQFISSTNIQGAIEELLDEASSLQVTTVTGEQTVAEALDQRVIYVDTIADLQALDTTKLVDGQSIEVTDTVRAGDFVIRAGDFSTEVSSDPASGVWVSFDSDPTGSSIVAKRSEYDGASALYLKWFGASSGASPSDNYAAWVGAWNLMTSNGGGSIVLTELYNFGSNQIDITPDNAFGNRSSFEILGTSRSYRDQQTTLNYDTMVGIVSSSPVVFRWGSDSEDMVGFSSLRDFTIVATSSNQKGLDFRNSFANTNIVCDLDGVRLIDFSGASAIPVDQGRCVDGVWSNIKIFGKEPQPMCGINVVRELPTLISPQINFCKRSLYVRTSEVAYFNMVGGWSILPEIGHIVFEGGGANQKNQCSVTGASLLESDSSVSTPILVESPSGTTAHLSLINVQMDMPLDSANGRIIDFQCGGRLTMIGVTTFATSAPNLIKIGAFTALTAVQLQGGFDLEDDSGSSVAGINSGLARIGEFGFSSYPASSEPPSAKGGMTYLDDGSNSGTSRAAFRRYDPQAGAYFDMSPRFVANLRTGSATADRWITTWLEDGTPVFIPAATTAPV